MKVLSYIVPVVLGLGIGTALGWKRPDPKLLSGQPDKSPENVRFEANYAFGGSAFSSDARIVRLFSASLQPALLSRRFEYAEALHDLNAADFPALIKHVESLPPNLRDPLLPILFERWFELDSQAARMWARAHPNFSGIDAWVRLDPESAIQEALSAPQLGRSGEMLYKAIVQLAGKDPRAQIARLKALPKGSLQSQILSRVIESWAESEPAAAYAALGELGAGHDSVRDSILMSWASRDPAAALREMDAIVPTLQAGVLGNRLLTNVAERASGKDPRLVLDWLAGLPVEFRMAPAIAAAGQWAKSDPIAALEWCLANDVSVTRGRRMNIGSWSAGVMRQALSADGGKVADWLESLPAGVTRQTLMERALQDSLWRVPGQRIENEAISLRLFSALNEEAQVRSASALSSAFGAQASFPGLNEWARNFPSGPARAEALAGAMVGSYERGATQIDTLLSGVAAGPDRDAALRGLAQAMTPVSPADAANRALGIGDSLLRRDTLDAVFDIWIKRDPETSRAWLNKEMSIPAEWKERWLKREK